MLSVEIISVAAPKYNDPDSSDTIWYLIIANVIYVLRVFFIFVLLSKYLNLQIFHLISLE